MKTRSGAAFVLPLAGILALGPGGREADAQPLEVGRIAAPMEELTLEPDTDLGGRLAVVQGTADAEGRRYYAVNIRVMSPTVIAVFADDPARPIEVSLHRSVWNRPEASGTTDAEGNYEFTGRLESTVGIWLKAEQPSDYHLMLWVGEPVPVEVPPIFFDNDRPVRQTAEE